MISVQFRFLRSNLANARLVGSEESWFARGPHFSPISAERAEVVRWTLSLAMTVRRARPSHALLAATLQNHVVLHGSLKEMVTSHRPPPGLEQPRGQCRAASRPVAQLLPTCACHEKMGVSLPREDFAIRCQPALTARRPATGRALRLALPLAVAARTTGRHAAARHPQAFRPVPLQVSGMLVDCDCFAAPVLFVPPSGSLSRFSPCC